MARLSRRRVCAAAGVALALLGCERTVPPDAVRARLSALARPNLVLVVVDTLRADATTPYRRDLDTTPELDAWASRGVVFENVRAQSSWTKISMASLLTSLWPRSHGLRAARDGLAEEAVTVAEVLSDAGYRTYAVQTNGWLHPSFGLDQGFSRYGFPHGGGAGLARRGVWAHADRVYEETDRLLDAHDGSAPFFLYLHFMDVHEYAAPPEHQRFGSDDRGAYLAAVRWVDEVVARVRRRLDRKGWLDRTVMLLASDHGEAFGENGVRGHAKNVQTSQIAVPLVIRLPFGIDPPLRVAAQVRNLDIAPTLLALAGVDAPAQFEGRSLLPLALGEAPPEDRPAFAVLGDPLFPDARVQHALHEGRFSYLENRDGRPPEALLFDRRVDPGENVDLVEIEPETAARLRARLEAYDARASDALRRSDVRIDPSIAERLRALGYLGGDGTEGP